MKVEMNDNMGHRGREHLNLILAKDNDDEWVIFPFLGKTIHGIVTVVKEDYCKNGKTQARPSRRAFFCPCGCTMRARQDSSGSIRKRS